MSTKVNICWFRRDLRLQDHAALFRAQKDGLPVVPLFIFDRNILDELSERNDARVEFIHSSLFHMQEQLEKLGASLDIRYGRPLEVYQDLLKDYDIAAVYTASDYEPYARKRDGEVSDLFKKQNIGFISVKDQVIFEKGEISRDNSEPYQVFTPYSRTWKASLKENSLKPLEVKIEKELFYQQIKTKFPTLSSLGFEPAGQQFPSPIADKDIIKHYTETRDYPGIAGTTRLSVHLRFGTISPRRLTAIARDLNEKFLNELIWREFYQMILWHHPRVVSESFKPAYDKIQWRNNEAEFDAWCAGMTGYPIVDAGMRELNETGFMHNRVRMVVASFLCKHLLIDWRWGEAYFAKKLLDYDLASNNGGWQWAAGSGCDAAPYFRIFNPYIQTKKFDADLKYIRQWVPELEELHYPKPIVEHEAARKRCLEVYGRAVGK